MGIQVVLWHRLWPLSDTESRNGIFLSLLAEGENTARCLIWNISCKVKQKKEEANGHNATESGHRGTLDST